MRDRIRLQSPALAISLLALFVALGGSVYAASRINGRTIKVKSLPGNRLALHSLPANRLKRGLLGGGRLSLPLTGSDINELTLGQVPNATHAETADSAQSAVDAETALNAVNAVTAQRINGHTVGCETETQQFAGACWQKSVNPAAATAPEAAADCASHGGTLPGALELAAFAMLSDVTLDPGEEWSSEITNYSGADAYGVITVSAVGVIRSSFFNGGAEGPTKKYRCVMPIVS